MKKILVQKYGGTSVADVEHIQRVAQRIVKSKTDELDGIVVVVSAMGKTTDRLVTMANSISTTPHGREMDMLLSSGEQVTIALLSMALHELGQDAISLTGAQAGIFTEVHHTKAKILHINTDNILEAIEDGKIVIVAGFQGVTKNHQITTLGRGGSDTTAVALAGSLNAPICEIYTDVDGVFTTDPRVVSKAFKLNEISYEEMLELAYLGANVLHPRSVECAKKYGTILHVRSSFKEIEGTYVKDMNDLEIHQPVTGATVDMKQAKVAVRHVPDQPGIAAKLFGALSSANISVDMIIQAVQENQTNDIAFTVNEDDLKEAVEITKQVGEIIEAKDVIYDRNVAKVSIVGVGMIGTPGIAANMFKVLAESGINIEMISTSEIKISCVVAQDQAEKALKVIHDKFVIH